MNHITTYKKLREAQAKAGADETVTTTVSFLLALMRNSNGRDELAARAMQGMLGGHWPDTIHQPEIARRSYEMADAMLAERDGVKE